MTAQNFILDVEPTVFYTRERNELRHRVQVTLENSSDVPRSGIVMRVSAEGVDETLPLGALPPGQSQVELSMPDIRSPGPVRFELQAGSRTLHQHTCPWQPQRHWEVHLIHYCAPRPGLHRPAQQRPARVRGLYGPGARLLRGDGALARCTTPAFATSASRPGRWCTIWSSRPPEVAERLAHYAAAGQIEVTALYGNQTLELCSHEELVRLLYPAFRLKRELGIEITSAEHNDIPGFPWGLASVLAGAGIRYFSPGVPRWYFGQGEERVHPLWDTERALPLDMPAACWWEGPDGARVLLWSDLHGQEWQPYNYEQAQHELPGMLRQLESGGLSLRHGQLYPARRAPRQRAADDALCLPGARVEPALGLPAPDQHDQHALSARL